MHKANAMKLVRVRVENFLSLEHVELELEKLNVFVGPNASGKSNLVRVFQLLANHAKYGVPYLSGYKRFRDIAYKFDERATITVEVEGVIDSHNIRYTLTLTADNYSEKVWIDDKEALVSNGKSGVVSVLSERGEVVQVGAPSKYSSRNDKRVRVW